MAAATSSMVTEQSAEPLGSDVTAKLFRRGSDEKKSMVRSQSNLSSIMASVRNPMRLSKASVASTATAGMVMNTDCEYRRNQEFLRNSVSEVSNPVNYTRYLTRWQGSVFPSATAIALPSGIAAGVVKYLIEVEFLQMSGEGAPLSQVAAYTGFTALVGFLIVFRTSQAYARFWEGCTMAHLMRAKWFEAASMLVSFCKMSKAPKKDVLTFHNLAVRLFSMLHASALAAIEDASCLDKVMADNDIEAFTFELIDAEGIDIRSLCAIRDAECKVELIGQWIQNMIVEGMDKGVLNVPPPILTRVFQEYSQGMVSFHESMKISSIPFPFPYCQMCDILLIIHWLMTPLVVSQWVYRWYWAALFTFVQVVVLWALNLIAVEIQNPFGFDDNDIDGRSSQNEFNRTLLLLLDHDAWRTPILSDQVTLFDTDEENAVDRRRTSCEGGKSKSFRDIWTNGSVALQHPRRVSTADLGEVARDLHNSESSRSHPQSIILIPTEYANDREVTGSERSLPTAGGGALGRGRNDSGFNSHQYPDTPRESVKEGAVTPRSEIFSSYRSPESPKSQATFGPAFDGVINAEAEESQRAKERGARHSLLRQSSKGSTVV